MKYYYEDAKCLNADPSLFDPVTKEEVGARLRIERALNYCRSCPLVVECHEDAVLALDDGVRGGVLIMRGHIQRLPALPKQSGPPKPLAPCGTPVAWQRHRRKRETCVACEKAREGARMPRPSRRKKTA